jgi:hypothetical protein
MSSAYRYMAQIAPNKFYRCSAAVDVLDANGADTTVNFPANGILADMGKTVYRPNGDVLRKVALMSVAGVSDTVVGYIYLVKIGGTAQAVASL